MKEVLTAETIFSKNIILFIKVLKGGGMAQLML